MTQCPSKKKENIMERENRKITKDKQLSTFCIEHYD